MSLDENELLKRVSLFETLYIQNFMQALVGIGADAENLLLCNDGDAHKDSEHMTELMDRLSGAYFLDAHYAVLRVLTDYVTTEIKRRFEPAEGGNNNLDRNSLENLWRIASAAQALSYNICFHYMHDKSSKYHKLKGSCHPTKVGSTYFGISIEIANLLELDDTSSPEGKKMRKKIIALSNELPTIVETLSAEAVKCDEDFAPLAVTRDLLAEYRELVMNQIPNLKAASLQTLMEYSMSFSLLGDLFRMRFQSRLGELQAIEGHKNYRINVKDFNGRLYSRDAV
jgi:hypothetical protein